VKSKGPKVAYSLVNKKYSKLSSEALHHALANEISTMKGATVKYAAAVLHFANSLLYEKTNDGYIHESPVELEQYLADFASENTVIVDGPSMGMCKGCNGWWLDIIHFWKQRVSLHVKPAMKLFVGSAICRKMRLRYWLESGSCVLSAAESLASRCNSR
jgi:hypothetical protein